MAALLLELKKKEKKRKKRKNWHITIRFFTICTLIPVVKKSIFSANS